MDNLTYCAANVYIFLPYIITVRTAGTDKNEEITALSVNLWQSKTGEPYHIANPRNCTSVDPTFAATMTRGVSITAMQINFLVYSGGKVLRAAVGRCPCNITGHSVIRSFLF